MGSFDFVAYILVPLLIVLARIIDVSIGTIRIILIGKGYRMYAMLLGFVESIVWITATGYIMQNLDSVYNYFAYASGFALGTYFGVFLEGKISIGKVMVRIITNRDNTDLVNNLFERNYSFTTTDAEGRLGQVKIIFLVLKRKAVPHLVSIINEYNPNAFYTIEDVRFVKETQGSTMASLSTVDQLKHTTLKRK